MAVGVMDKQTELEKLISHMLKHGNDMFFAYAIVRMERHVIDTKEEEEEFGQGGFLAGVDFSANDNFKLLVSHKFFDLPLQQKIAVLKHEIYHIISLHSLRVTLDEYKDNGQLYNIAMDLEINQLLDNLPKEAISLDGLNKQFPKAKLEPNEKFETYYYKLKKHVPHTKVHMAGKCPKCGGTGQEPNNSKSKGQSQGDQDKKPCSSCGGNGGAGGFDIHPYLDKLKKDKDKGNATYNKMIDKARELASQAKDDTIRSRGYLSSDVENYIDTLFDVDPFIKLRNFVGRIPSANKDITYFKIDRRTRMMPSYKREYKEHIMIAIDTSGSIGDDEIILFLSHIEKLMKQYNEKADLSVVFCDAQVQDIIYEYKSARKDVIGKKLKMGRGGTEFKPALDLVKTNKKFREVTKILYFTDGYGEYVEDIYNQHIMWIYTPNNHSDVEMVKGNKYEHIKLPQSFFERGTDFKRR